MTMAFAGKTAVVGIGATEFSKNSGRSTLRLAVECCDAAIRDAGLTPDQIDGIVSYTVEENHEIDVARNLGIKELTHFSRIHHTNARGPVSAWAYKR
jgi:3-oxoacyl-[acyl-carrier-protein] synthase III